MAVEEIFRRNEEKGGFTRFCGCWKLETQYLVCGVIRIIAGEISEEKGKCRNGFDSLGCKFRYFRIGKFWLFYGVSWTLLFCVKVV